MWRIARLGVVACALIAFGLVACDDEGDGGNGPGEPEATSTVEATEAAVDATEAPEPATDASAETPESSELDPALLAALEDFALERYSQLAGPCAETQDPETDVGKFCYFPPEEQDGRVSIIVGKALSDETYALTLERSTDGEYQITDIQESP